MKEKGKENKEVARKIVLCIFSILVSIALWVYVTGTDNSVSTVPVSNIPIEFLNEESLTERGLVVTNISKESVSLRLSGKLANLAGLNNETVTVSVDLSDIASSTPGVYQLTYDINYPTGTGFNNITVSSASVDYITVTVERYATKTVEIRGEYDGNIAEGYLAEQMEFEPGTITVSGPESVVSTIESANVYIRSDNISATIEQDVPFTLKNSAGEDVDTAKLTFSDETIHVKLPIVMVKEVPLKINFVDGNSVTGDDAIVTYEPQKITISGDPAILETVNQIVLGTIDLTSFLTTTTTTFPITVPNDVSNLSGEATATVSVEIKGLSSVHFSATDIQVTNVPAGYTHNIITQSLDVTVRGKEDELEGITSDNIRIVADLSEFVNSSGVFSVPAEVHVDGFPNVDAVGSFFVSVTLTKS